MKTEQIPIGNVGVITRYEFAGVPEKKSVIYTPLKKRELSLDDYATIYHQENLYEVDGKKYPLVFIGGTNNLKTQKVELSDSVYCVPKELACLKQEVLKHKLKPHHTNGACIRVMDIESDGEKTHLKLQQAGYFDHMATDLAKDFELNQFYEIFGQGKTLRDYEVVNGKAKPLKESKLVNLLAMPFIMLSEEKGKEYIIFVPRGKQRQVAGGTLSILGGIPEWGGLIQIGGNNFKDYIKWMADKEMGEEICLEPNEFKVEKISWWKDFTRAPDVLICMRTKVPIDELAKRCSTSDEAKKEHSSLYKIPANLEMIKAMKKEKSLHFFNILTPLLDWYFKN